MLAHAGRDACAACCGLCRDQGAVHGHGLRRVFDAAGGAEPAVGAQRIVGGAVAAAAAADPLGIPVEHLVEEAHAALVRDVPLDPARDLARTAHLDRQAMLIQIVEHHAARSRQRERRSNGRLRAAGIERAQRLELRIRRAIVGAPVRSSAIVEPRAATSSAVGVRHQRHPEGVRDRPLGMQRLGIVRVVGDRARRASRSTLTCASASRRPAPKLPSKAQSTFDARRGAGRDTPVAGGGIVYRVVKSASARSARSAEASACADLVTVVAVAAGGGEHRSAVAQASAPALRRPPRAAIASASFTTRPVRRRSAGGSMRGRGSTVGRGR